MKNKLIIITLFIFILLGTQPQKVTASERVAGASASLVQKKADTRKEDRIRSLRAYLEKYNSPLRDEADTFIVEAERYNLDYKLLPAIAGVESGFGKQIPYNSYNGWGWGIYGDNMILFPSWKEAIQTISRELRKQYMDTWQANDIYAIGSYYAADPSWAHKVSYFMNDIEEFSSKSKLIAIEL